MHARIREYSRDMSQALDFFSLTSLHIVVSYRNIEKEKGRTHDAYDLGRHSSYWMQEVGVGALRATKRVLALKVVVPPNVVHSLSCGRRRAV